MRVGTVMSTTVCWVHRTVGVESNHLLSFVTFWTRGGLCLVLCRYRLLGTHHTGKRPRSGPVTGTGIVSPDAS